ncbi:MAG: hypothetical protein H6765_00065 [Candidatus Peribacteria bacterium]|nr:MAG: hypothetical protein H6765_00065 [Candidatus Peribacteria bacterium]
MIVFVVMVCFTFFLEIVQLANLTSFVMLTIFCLVNGGLRWIKIREHRQGSQEAAHYTVPTRIPAVGLLINLLFIGAKILSLF